MRYWRTCAVLLLTLGLSVVVYLIIAWPMWQAETCKKNLGSVEKAILEFDNKNREFPAAYTGDPPRSWRVELLPFLDEADLYQQYDQSSAWDSSSNRSLLDQRPDAYRCPLVQDNTRTAFQAVVGFQTAWPFHHNVEWVDLARGTANTIHLVESHDPTVEWTSTKDISWNAATKGLPPARHGRGKSKTLNVAFASGSVHTISKEISVDLYRKLLTPNYGDLVGRNGDWSEEELEAFSSEQTKAALADAPEYGEPVDPASMSATRMLPFDDEEIGAGENMIYCPTFVLAWKNYVANVKQLTETEFSRKISASKFSKDDIDPKDVRILGGHLSGRDITNAFAELGMSSTVPVIPSGDYGHVAFCALSKQLPFEAKFELFLNPLKFRAGNEIIEVQSFGVTSHWEDWGIALSQIEVLDYRSPDDFTIRIANLKGEDMILAKMPQPVSLADGVDRIKNKIMSTNVGQDAKSVVAGEQVVIPVLNLSLQADFHKKLYVSNQPVGSRLIAANQVIKFRLDENGARLESFAVVVADNGHYEHKVGERTFIFDRPFMVVLRESSRSQPYFAAWIANGDLMSPYE